MRILANSVEIPYQETDDGVLVRAAGGVGAGGTITWVVNNTSIGSTFTPQAWVTDTGTYYELDNGLVAVRIPKSIPCPTPATFVSVPPDNRVLSPSQILAPIQGFRHADGTWTGTGPNYLLNWGALNEASATGSWNYPATAPAVIEVLESGPLRVKVKVSYTGSLRPYYGDAEGNYVTRHSSGYYICTITLEAWQKTISIENETDGRINWTVNMNTGVNANRGRYKGHGADTIADGHNYDGTVYELGGGHLEGECELSAAGQRPGYDWTLTPPTGFDGVWWNGVDHWWEWQHNTGVYWYLYNSAGSSSSNIWGIIEGSPDLGDQRRARAGVYGTPAAGTPTVVGFYTYAGVDVTWHGEAVALPWDGYPAKYSFNIFLGTKGDDVPVDFSTIAAFDAEGIPDAGSYPVNPSSIAKALTLRSGTAQAWKQLDQGVDFPDPVGGYPGMHLTRAETEALIANLEADQSPSSYYAELYAGDAPYRDVWDAFADDTNAEASVVVQYCLDFFSYGMDVFVNKGSHHHPTWHYWLGGLRFQKILIRTMAMISLDQVRPFMTALQKKQLKAAMSMAGHIMWDPNFVPILEYFKGFSSHAQFTFGTANMPPQYEAQQSQITLTLRTHPQFAGERFDSVLSKVVSTFDSSIVASGAPKDSPHYAGTLVIPSTDIFRQLQVSNYADVFAPSSSIYNKLVLLGEYCLQIMTPPQSRFVIASGSTTPLRKIVCYGDGSSESSNLAIGIMMGMKPHNLTLSKRLAWGWDKMGRPLDSFYSSTGLKIEPAPAMQDAALGDCDIEGFATIMRSGWETADESAVFLLHGYANVDHHTRQRGSPSFYLLSEPICLSFGSLYNPHLDYPYLSCSTYIPESKLDSDNIHPTQNWATYTALQLACDDHASYFNDTYTHSFTALRGDVECAFEVSDNWVRRMTFYKDDLACPVVRLRDSNDEVGDSVYTLHLMATGAVTKPDSSTYTPPLPPDFGGTALQDTVYNGPTFAITNGQRLLFTGQWGVNFDFYYFGPPATAMIASFYHRWSPTTEQSQLYWATGVFPFLEMQYILRIKTAGPCDTVVVPYRTRPAGLNVTQTTGGLNLVTTATIGSPRFLADEP